ncbi:DUF4230 domain-containing protein [Mesonia aestuariivivens]|uniref:DUF4230 domain-containing protein n=1 Tax=Mesonia aestuariivivens TaxID=2796128 RepID=A0ABS6W3F0_9FLAO|nr:DUF4230 domain-containing protein [Mesonia aestuariivivens]MBW2962370.1 DUF4230 domain-containing protein [Mesonia aestuariivivens]
MRKFLLGILVSLVCFFGYEYFKNQFQENENLLQASNLIEKEIKNVSKLVVSEGSYAKVYTYENTESFVFKFLLARKKALIVVNAKANVSYDLRKMKYEVDAEQKTLRITHIPDPELHINPDIKYYDVTQDYLNQFDAKDYNKIKGKINSDLRDQIKNSVLMKNAENRLIAELQKLFVLTSSMGWTLQYNQENFLTAEDLKNLNL